MSLYQPIEVNPYKCYSILYMNDLGDFQIKRSNRDSQTISIDILYLILNRHPYREFVIK
jgi:hypothetical protein